MSLSVFTSEIIDGSPFAFPFTLVNIAVNG